METTTTVRLRWTRPPHPMLATAPDGATSLQWNPLIRLPEVGSTLTILIADIGEEIEVRVERVVPGISVHLSLSLAIMAAELWVVPA